MYRYRGAVEMLDALAAEGRTDVTQAEVRDRLGLSSQAASNLLTRLARDGFVERVRRGTYLLHPLGELGVSAAASDRLGELVVTVVGDRQHRICYRTALHEHGLLTRPGRRVQVAVDRRLFVKEVGGRPLESIIERSESIHRGAEPAGPGMRSTVERALLESAWRPKRVGGATTVAEALAAARPHAPTLNSLAAELGAGIGLRRLGSMNEQLRLGRIDVSKPPSWDRIVRLDPADHRDAGPTDERWGVRWPGPVTELAEVVRQ